MNSTRSNTYKHFQPCCYYKKNSKDVTKVYWYARNFICSKSHTRRAYFNAQNNKYESVLDLVQFWIFFLFFSTLFFEIQEFKFEFLTLFFEFPTLFFEYPTLFFEIQRLIFEIQRLVQSI